MLSLTSPALALAIAIRFYNRIFRGVFMPMNAMSCSSLHSARHILSVRHLLKVVGIATRPIPTEVINIQIVAVVATKYDIGNDVGPLWTCIPPNDSISILRVSSPKPAPSFMIDMDLVPKPIWQTTITKRTHAITDHGPVSVFTIRRVMDHWIVEYFIYVLPPVALYATR